VVGGGSGERYCCDGCSSEDHGVYASAGGRKVPLTCFAFAGFTAGFGLGVGLVAGFDGVVEVGGAAGGVKTPVSVLVGGSAVVVVVVVPLVVWAGGCVSVGVDPVVVVPVVPVVVVPVDPVVVVPVVSVVPVVEPVVPVVEPVVPVVPVVDVWHAPNVSFSCPACGVPSWLK
jgi:hypothetical protein